MRHLRPLIVTLILLLAIPLHALAGTLESGGGGVGDAAKVHLNNLLSCEDTLNSI